MPAPRPARSLAHPFLAVAGVVAVAALIAGCSSSDSSASPTSSTPATGAETAKERDKAATAEPVARYVGYESQVYADPAHWVCRPGADDVCDAGLDATVVAADGTLTPQPWKADPNAPIDCFYVYPTISSDPGDFSDLVPGDEERFVTLNQAARLGSDCRVFAPVYRQRTLAGLGRALGGSTGTSTPTGIDRDQPYLDVLDAFKQYMSHDNQGRGVVLIGHSQGAGLIERLIAEEVDTDPQVRDHLVAAYLAGTAVAVPEGKDVGGDLKTVPLCRAKDQNGCVVTWASFRSTSPPPDDALFGKPRDGAGVAGCTNPADLAGGSAELHPYFPSSPSASILSSLGASTDGDQPWVDPSRGTIDTPFVTTPGLVSGECVTHDGRTYLEITVHADPEDPRRDDIGGDLTPEWGLHLQDINVTMGDIVTLVAAQSQAWRDAHS